MIIIYYTYVSTSQEMSLDSDKVFVYLAYLCHNLPVCLETGKCGRIRSLQWASSQDGSQGQEGRNKKMFCKKIIFSSSLGSVGSEVFSGDESGTDSDEH